MATLYDQQGTEIYAGRGKYSHRARQMIERREAYTRSEEGALSVYVPARPNPRTSTCFHPSRRCTHAQARRTATGPNNSASSTTIIPLKSE